MKPPAHRTHRLLALSLLLAAAPAALATDHYVDPVHGDDANGGSSWADAWRTITHAVATGGSATYHLAPGVYDAALGESFPIALPSGSALVGEQGSALTVLDGGGSGALLRPNAWGGTQLTGLWLRNAWSGIDGGGYVCQWSLSDVRATALGGSGVAVSAVSGDPLVLPVDVRVTLERVTLEGCQIGLLASCSADYDDQAEMPRIEVSVADSQVRGCEVGLVVTAMGWAESHLDVRRSRIVDNASGVLATYFCSDDWGCGWSHATLEDTLLASNQTGCHADTSMVLERCTVAANASCGASSTGALSLSQCVVFGNGDDLCGTGLFAETCDIGDGDFAGMDGNFAADPLFVDPALGDFRLGWGSPCAEAGYDAGAEGRDLDGRPRPLDGDLDLVPAPDIGALELALLDHVRGAPGTPALEIFGEPGGRSMVLFHRGGLLGTPVATPFGPLHLDRERARPFANARHSGSHLPAPIPRLLALDVSLSGATFGFQALSPSILAPAGLAYTNPVVIALP